MDKTLCLFVTFTLVYASSTEENRSSTVNNGIIDKSKLKNKVIEMFNHAYGAYKTYAHPADELMPLSCKGRYRGSEVDRGDIDEALGNFSLTLIDTLDTLVLFGEIAEFETQVRYVIKNVSFDADAVVSVFETNIRVLGGLLGAHSMAVTLKKNNKGMQWYGKELLDKATILADKLLVAFNTSTGIPYPKVNLRYGIHNPNSRVGHETHTCTACAGTMIMEFGALSRLTGNPIYEEKAHKAMEALWKYRSHHSDLVGTTINIHSGDWTRRDSGVGAGIDSYYEYCLKAYILLGDETYKYKFNKHYAAIKKYIRQGFMMLDVYMHQPYTPARSFIDALQAFWPGLQVLKGDIQPAIETHEVLYNVAKKYKFIPEAFTTNLDLYWAQHPLRPEFIESTYFLYQATKDPYYLEVGKHVIDTLEDHARVKCGYAAFKDLRTFAHDDKMDSFVLAETFKYLYLLFSEESEHTINIHDFIFTTEAHLLPLYLSQTPAPPTNATESANAKRKQKEEAATERNNKTLIEFKEQDHSHSSCPNTKYLSNLKNFAESIRNNVNTVGNNAKLPNAFCRKNAAGGGDADGTGGSFTRMTAESFLAKIKIKTSGRKRRISVKEVDVNNQEHVEILKDLGINVLREANGRIQLQHQSQKAKTPDDAEEGILFMQEMIEFAKETGLTQDQPTKPRYLKLVSAPFNGNTVYQGGYSQFGSDLDRRPIKGELVRAIPVGACELILNSAAIINRVVVIKRGGCMFIDKVRLAEKLGAVGVIIVDHNEGTSFSTSAPFGMSGDENPDNVGIPSMFLFNKEGEELLQHMDDVYDKDNKNIVAVLHGEKMNEAAAADPDNGVKAEDNSSSEAPRGDFASGLPDSLFVGTKTGVEITSNGRKITKMVSEYTGANEGGIVKKFVRTITHTCPNTDCTSIHISTRTVVVEKQEEVDDRTENPTLVDDGVKKREEMLRVIDSGSSNSIKNVKDMVDESYLDDALSELVKKHLVANDNKELSVNKGGEDVFCTSAGCYNTLEELKDIQLLADSITQLQAKLGESSRVEQTLDRMQEEISSDIEKTLRGSATATRQVKRKGGIVDVQQADTERRTTLHHEDGDDLSKDGSDAKP